VFTGGAAMELIGARVGFARVSGVAGVRAQRGSGRGWRGRRASRLQALADPPPGDAGSVDSGADDVEDALLEGDRTIEAGGARAALGYPVFRRIYLAALVSNVGSWMQTVVLAAFVFNQTGSSTDVGLMTLAQLGPLFLLAPVGGVLADRFDRRTILMVVTVEQGIVALVIAWLTRAHDPRIAVLFVVVLASGIGQALYAPTYSALIPTLVDRKDLSGAISLNSANMNLSRVIGPAIGGVLYAKVGAPWAFVFNAVSYLALIGALATVHLPAVLAGKQQGWRRVLDGFAVARRDRVVGRCLMTLVMFSFFCLPIAVLMPVLAHDDLRIKANTIAYGLLYAIFGAGAVVGALAIGTFLAGRQLESIVRIGLGGFAVSLAAFGLLRSPGPAYPVAFLLGLFYFATVTSLATVLQRRLEDSVRGRVMALWVMAFGGTVPLGAIVAGPLSGRYGISAVVVGGAVVAGLLVFFADLHDRPVPEAIGRGAVLPRGPR
jgi:predicted MFS family arabinose efflux permease